MKYLTELWWSKCLNDNEKLEHWLVSLYNNEKDAEFRFTSFGINYCFHNDEIHGIFMQIAEQERKHAILVEDVLKKRNIKLYEKSSANGRYWRNTLPCVCDMKTAAAIAAYAEGLSLKRMRIIIKDPRTPKDLVELFSIIEPEESYHAKILQQIATKYGMKKVKDCHDKGLEALGLKIIKTK